MGKHKSKREKSEKKSKKYESNSSSEDEWIEKQYVPSPSTLVKRKHSSTSTSNAECETMYSKDKKESTLSHDTDKKNVREDWMNLTTSFHTHSNINHRRRQREDKQKEDRKKQQYNPQECKLELNPYWKDGGDGLPKFQKPSSSLECYKDESSISSNYYQKNDSIKKMKWKKEIRDDSQEYSEFTQNSKNINPELVKNANNQREIKSDTETCVKETWTEKDLNLLGARIVKAEILGNTKLVAQLKDMLERAKQNIVLESLNEESVVLTHMNSQGQSHPISLSSSVEYTKHKRQKNIETHKNGNRLRYFADDDKYSLKQMFEKEKYNSVEDNNRQFLNMTKKVSKNEDLDDVFCDNIRKEKEDSKTEKRNIDKAISQHKQISKSLDNCNKCIQSDLMPKHLMVSMGETVYLQLPFCEPLTKGHCLINPIRHTPCSTQLDENEWSDVLNMRKALVRMFQSIGNEVIFFECVTNLSHFPHMSIECVPVVKEEADMAPIYFKKAIDECEMEWSQNKKLISLKGRDVRKAIPKGLPYFFVSFGLEEGFAHVIEDEQLFPKNFAQEIIGGMLDIHHSKWRKPKRQSFEEQSQRVLHFSNIWKGFDCTL